MGYARPHYRCTACGAVNEAPACAAAKLPERFDMFKAEPAQAAAAPPAPPTGQRELLLQGTDDEWDHNPYAVRGDVPTARCPECGKAIHEGVSVCKHCGVDFEAKKKAERTFVPVDRQWENGWPLQKRVAAFVVLQAFSIAVSIALLATGFSAVAVCSIALVSAGLMASLIGTCDRLHLTRTTKGKVVLTHTWRYAFIAWPPRTIRWKEHEGVCIASSDEVDPFEWMMAGFLCLYAIFHGVLFWWMVIRPDKFDVALCKHHGHPTTLICRTTKLGRAQEIMMAISAVAVLPVVK